MPPFRLSVIALSVVLIAGCSDEPPPQEASAPLTLDADNTQLVTLKIPGVDDQVDTSKPTTDNNELVIGAIERDVPVELDAGSSIPTIDIPRPLLLSDIVRNRFSSLLQGSEAAVDSVFYPLGWSTDGKLAYAIEPPDEAAGVYALNVYIQDLVTDKILWQDKYQSKPETSTGIRSFAAYWQANQATLKAQLSKYGIKQASDSALFAGAITNEDDRIDYSVTKTLKGQPNFGNTDMVTEYQVQVTSEKLGSKTVHKERYKNPIDVLDVEVIGYLRGNDQKRAALLIAGVKRGWEGPPHTTWFKVIGTNLKHGFKKKSSK